MKKKLFAVVLAVVVCVASLSTAFAMSADEARKAAAGVVNTTTDASKVTSPFIDVVKNVQGSVVGVNNYQNYTVSSYSPYYGFGGFGFGGYGRGSREGRSSETTEKLTSTGSGVVVYDHVVLTNYHVVENATRLTLSILNSDDEIAATVVAYDEAQDLAVVYAPELKLAPVALGDSDQLQVGEWSICIGNPLSDELRGTVTVGIISALDRQINSTTTTDKYGLKRQVTNSMIQTDAAINSGNSGGGMFNVLGQLMGIPSMKFSNNSSYSSGNATIEGIGLVIPINTAKSLIEEAVTQVLIGDVQAPASDDNSAKTVSTGDKPMLGVTISPLSASNDYRVYTGQLPTGMQVIELVEGAPAAAAGIQVNDIIVEVDGVLADTATHVQQTLASRSFGDTISVKVYRAEGMDNTDGQVGEGQYLDFDVNLFEFNTAA